MCLCSFSSVVSKKAMVTVLLVFMMAKFSSAQRWVSVRRSCSSDGVCAIRARSSAKSTAPVHRSCGSCGEFVCRARRGKRAWRCSNRELIMKAYSSGESLDPSSSPMFMSYASESGVSGCMTLPFGAVYSVCKLRQSLPWMPFSCSCAHSAGLHVLGKAVLKSMKAIYVGRCSSCLLARIFWVRK